jgi:hypothetical protein
MKLSKVVSTILAISFLAVSNTALASSAKTYKTSQGIVQLDLLQQQLSNRLNADVSNVRLRWSLNPMDALVGATAEYHTYALAFDINHEHHVLCNLVMIDNSDDEESGDSVMVSHCKSDVDVTVEGFIMYSDIGITTFGRNK